LISEWLCINRAERHFAYIVAEVETAALGHASTAITPKAYWDATPEATHLSNGDGRIVQITADGVSIVDNGTDGVLFAAGRSLPAWTLTTPADPFETCALFRDSRQPPSMAGTWLASGS
jgi:hypothetical protein